MVDLESLKKKNKRNYNKMWVTKKTKVEHKEKTNGFKSWKQNINISVSDYPKRSDFFIK